MKYALFMGAQGRKFVGEPGFGEVVAAISTESGAYITRHVADEAAADLLHSVGQHTQAEVIKLSLAHTPGFGPANPVNESTHCRYNDGIAYSFWPKFARIPKWARGIDVEIALRDAFCAVARKHGYTVTVTYPGSVGEAQHVNFRKEPRVNLWALAPLQHGSGGSRARQVIRLLEGLKVPGTDRKYLGGGPHANHKDLGTKVVAAIEHFQKDHHQKPDGIVGVHTIRSLRAAKRAQERRKENHK